jgi:serine/threonine protein kinase
MQTFKLERKDTLIGPSGERYPLEKLLGRGTFGRVFSSGPDKIVKLLEARNLKATLEEVTIQTKLNETVPDVCPKLYSSGLVPRTNEYAIVMERCEGTAEDLFLSNPDPELRLQYFEQVAKILQKLEPYRFNHRDLKSDNVMYKRDPTTGKYTFLLIDFGFSCITLDGKKYAGTLYFKSTDKCFRRSRDLAQLMFESMRHLNGDLLTFAQLVLTFTYKGKTCDMSKGCPPDFRASWSDTYDFLNTPGVENPNTTPEGLIRAVETYRKGGLGACRAGFVVHPVANQCVPAPPPPAPAALKPAVSPKPHYANPVVMGAKTARRILGIPSKTSRQLSPCPPGKVRNPKTRRCVKAKAAAAPCPPGKVRNPKTGRCIKI